MSATIKIRISSRDLDLIDRAAEIEGKTRSAFLRDCASKTALDVFAHPRLLGERCPVCGHVAAIRRGE